MANALEVSIPYFFEEMSAEVGAQSPSALIKAGRQPLAVGSETDRLAKRETLEFVRAYYRITDSAVRKQLAVLTKTLARSAG
jgi:hypothetical protein